MLGFTNIGILIIDDCREEILLSIQHSLQILQE